MPFEIVAYGTLKGLDQTTYMVGKRAKIIDETYKYKSTNESVSMKKGTIGSDSL